MVAHTHSVGVTYEDRCFLVSAGRVICLYIGKINFCIEICNLSAYCRVARKATKKISK